MMSLAAKLRTGRGLAHKADLQSVLPLLNPGLPMLNPGHVRNGDDCAAIPDGNGHLLFAIEGFVEDFVAADPYFAGYCGVMVNASDVYAMGGRPIAVVDAVWSCGHDRAAPLLRGLSEAAAIYGIPVVGGHTNLRASSGQLAVAILGRASALLTSFDAVPGDLLVAAIDLRGAFRPGTPYWDASTGRAPLELRAALDILPMLAEARLCHAAKDISMAGLAGTALMLAEASGIGIALDVDSIPLPPGTERDSWLVAFPSYGFLLSVRPAHVARVCNAFASVGVVAACIGTCNDTRRVTLQTAEGSEVFWDLSDNDFMNLTVRESRVQNA
jgi:AIR synthase-related protein